MIVTPVPLAIPVEKTEEGYDYPPVIDYHPGLPGRKNATPCASTAELFREYTHFNLRVGSILLPKTCAIIGQENILVERPIADCGSSNVLLVKVLNTENSERSRQRTLHPSSVWRAAPAQRPHCASGGATPHALHPQ